MAIQTALYHRTTYTFDRPTTIHPHIIRLRPAPHCRTPILSYSLKIEPEDHFINWQQDPFGNYLARLVFPEKAEKLNIVVDLVADMTVINPFNFFLDDSAETCPFEYSESAKQDLSAYLRRTDDYAGLDELAAELKPEEDMPTIDFLVSVNSYICNLLNYNLRLEVGVQTCEETLTKGSGSCRDYSYLMVQLFRTMGIAARFVSGYSVQLVADEKPIEGPEGTTEDVTDLHAWAEVFLPGAGWVGLDATSGLFAGEGHIPLACTPEPSSAAPIVGSTSKAEVEFGFENTVTRVVEDPRVTKPYSREQWAAIDALGEEVDNHLEKGDVRLTMGGEPTFVSIDDMEGDEWNSTADSTAKRRLSIELTRRLRDKYAPGGLIWFGEGKWYPGEPVPRWAYGIFWRKDEYPMWGSQSTQADPAEEGSYVVHDAWVLTEAISEALKVSKDCAMPALEDIDYYRWKESTLPYTEKLDESGEDDSLERRTIAELEKRGLEMPAGFVLPVFYDDEASRWITARWKFRREKLYLIPGASAMGFRLPLDSIRKATKKDVIDMVSPMETSRESLDANPLKDYDGEESEPIDQESGDWVPRTAISVEVREGRLHVFMPPTAKLEHYLELLAGIELAASKTELAVVIEGYEPPHDARVDSLKVTPDPGVIEINIHPASDWEEMKDRTFTVYEEARVSRLCAEKFMLDGKHSGTGGGNHVVMGGKTPSDSPFLRRPDLLASMVAYWQNHPGLSYLFSGLFIGPTSQAPRVDESRDDRLFELDIALDALRHKVTEPFMIDRVMRHLLTDLTGNTHRAEFCIDKMCNPGSKTGQLGLLELRNFEMPPHKEMSLVQSLFVRALLTMFWEKPYDRPLTRWGTALHDRFMLPHYVWKDVEDVCSDLKDHGFPFSPDWLLPFYEFRFPVFGRAIHQGIELELRTALEPWHVLGEESTSQGTSRYVDSSLERLQIKARGLIDGRHIVTCNGRRVPMYGTGINGESVGAVRFKAWDPPSALHPMIGAQTPLTFDIVDTQNRKSLGGCVYNVSHPGGRSHEDFPINARGAESRRVERFWQDGHTPGTMETSQIGGDRFAQFESYTGVGDLTVIPPEKISREYPATLDLRLPY